MARDSWKRIARRVVKAALGLLVLAAVGRHVLRTWRDLHERGQTLHVEPAWLVAAGLAYLAGLAACGIVFDRVLAASATPVGPLAALRAYLISHLGKYVPGKAMVVVMRVGLVTPHGARAATAALATFYETLLMMATGAVVAAVGFALGGRPLPLVPLALSAGLATLLLLVVAPPIFPRLSNLLTMPFPRLGGQIHPHYSWRLMGLGFGWSLLGWILLGLSQVAVIRAIAPAGVELRLWPLVTAGVALATVAGFVVAVLPGGLGVREGVLMTTLAPAVGSDTAVVAALALRLVWVAAEVGAAALLAVVRPADRASRSTLDPEFAVEPRPTVEASAGAGAVRP